MALLSMLTEWAFGPWKTRLLYIAAAVAFTLILECRADALSGPLAYCKKVLKGLEEIFVYMLLLSMFHFLDLFSGLPDTGVRLASIAILSEKLLAALKAASILGYSRITDALEDVYGYLSHLVSRKDESKEEHKGY